MVWKILNKIKIYLTLKSRFLQDLHHTIEILELSIQKEMIQQFTSKISFTGRIQKINE